MGSMPRLKGRPITHHHNCALPEQVPIWDMKKHVASEIKPFQFSQCNAAHHMTTDFGSGATRIEVSPEGVNALAASLTALPIVEFASSMLD